MRGGQTLDVVITVYETKFVPEASQKVPRKFFLFVLLVFFLLIFNLNLIAFLIFNLSR